MKAGTTAPTAFQFTPLREGRQEGDCLPRERRISIHAPPRGATEPYCHFLVSGEFQFTPLREGRLQYYQRYLFQKLFQFTPLREGRELK